MNKIKTKKVASAILAFTFLLLTHCTSAPKAENHASHRPPTNTSAHPPHAEQGLNIDVFGLQKGLGLSRNIESLGFIERKFNTCDAGYGFSRSHNCHSKYFVVIHFQLLCRDSEGTISTALKASDMRPISRRSVNWIIKPLSGRLETDSYGFGQIRLISSQSQKQQRLKLAVGNDFLYMRANEITQVVTPQPWCNP